MIALGILKDERAIEPLILVINAGGSTEEHAIDVLGEFGDKRAIQPLITSIKRGKQFSGRKAVAVLVKIAGEQAIEPLISTLDGNEDSIKSAIFAEFKNIGDTRVIKPLLAQLPVKAQVLHPHLKHGIIDALERVLLRDSRNATVGDLNTIVNLKKIMEEDKEDYYEVDASALKQVASQELMRRRLDGSNTFLQREIRVSILFFEDTPGKRGLELYFKKATTRYIWFKAEFIHLRPQNPLTLKVEATYYRANGSIVGKANLETEVQQGWASCKSGIGWDTPGKWSLGLHHVDLSINGEMIVRGYFEIV